MLKICVSDFFLALVRPNTGYAMTSAQKIILSVLAIVVLATVGAVLVANLGIIGGGDPEVRKNFAVWGSGSVLAEIVALFVLVGKRAFSTSGRMSIQLMPSPDFPQLTPRRINWNDHKCVLKTERVETTVKLIRSQPGQSWTVHIPADFMEKIAETDWIELRLEDDKGNEWTAGPILKNEYTIYLASLDSEQIKVAYGSTMQ